ncbi:GNAT superfamily N-acetyltransferase [Microbacterium sp. W4I4]|uniref:GNAT family N-acetyltransferase n=1 Tax=Microbacterium sp. W4I4 TaxID=3042295 RepID=UPI00277D46DF|nr:GNAT family N-acetyltransferase [Microbacterium sp. W4I4]MDQ0615064.1 GNAT superfamily N-acetyltransferase [Microbacterium sp. W4I4]
MMDQLLQAYDDQLREGAEVGGATAVVRIGPLWLAQFPGERGFITYRSLPDDAQEIAGLADAALKHFRERTGATAVEWKTRAHDAAPGLEAVLTGHGFVADGPESIMIGRVEGLAADVALPHGIEVRRAATVDDVWAASEMQGLVFDDPHWRSRAEDAVRKLEEKSAASLWIAVADGAVVSAGRLEPVDGTDFAGIWGGATLPEWRHRGIYRVLTARRAEEALRLGKTLIHSDSTGFSRPILERSGLVAVSTTTPFVWTR